MRIIWRIDDGYVNNSPHYLEIDDEELADYDEGDERQEFIEECVQEEFDNKIGFNYEIQEE